MKRKVIKPNVVSGGVAIPLGDNMYLMKGRKHKNGGIDIGNDPKTGIEVEDGEVMQMTNKGAKIFSAMPLLRGSSPANEVLSGANPNDVFRRQEAYKDRNGINDDGSKKKAIGGQIPPYKNKYKQQLTYTPTLNLTNDQIYELQKNVLGEDKARYKKEVKKITNKVVDKTKPARTITDTQYDNRKNIIKDYNDQHKEKAYRSKKDMPFDHDINKYEKKQVKWIADWYNGRREQLYNNLYNYPYDLTPTWLSQYERDNDGDIIKKEIPFSKLYKKEKAIDKEYKRLVTNASSANLDSGIMVYADPFATGAYAKPVKYSKKDKYYNHTVGYRRDATDDVYVHERTHAADPVAQIKEVNRIPSIDNEDYTKSAKEVYSRLMQYRYKYNLNPKDKIDDAYLNNHRKELEDLDLDFMSDDELKFLFNEVAENKDNKSNKIRPMAKYGGFDKYAGGGINDDGSKKKAIGGQIPPYNTKNKSNMYQRMKDPNRKTITDWKTGKTSTHKLAYATVDDKVVVYPNIQEINGELYDFTDPKNNSGKWDSLRRAIDTGDTIQFKNETDADKFVNNYKKEFKGFNKYAGGGIARRNAFRTAFGNNVGIYPPGLDKLFPGNEVTKEERIFAHRFIPYSTDKNGKIIAYTITNPIYDKEDANKDRIRWLQNTNRFAQNLYRANNPISIPDKINPLEDRGIPYVNKDAINYDIYSMRPNRFNNIDTPEAISYITPEEAKILRYNIDKRNTTNSSSKFSKFFKNKDNVSDLIGVGSNILGSTLSYFRNKSMLKNMQAPIKPTIAAPVSYQQTKLKTNVNINPQLDTLRNSSAIYNNSVDNNTASSRVALARKQVNRMNINNQINSLYGNKENQETELINKDRMQQQQTANQNVAQYNDYLNRKAALDNEYNNQLINFKNTINEKKAENAVSLFSNANTAIQDILGRREQRTNERNTIAAYLASHPDVNPRIFERLGINGVFTPEMIEAWEEEYKNNKKKK